MHPLLHAALVRRGGVFTTADAVAAGYTRHGIAAQLRSGRWHAVRYGVCTTQEIWHAYVSTGQEHGLEAAAVLARLGRDSAVVSHDAAARLHDLVVPAGSSPTVTLTDPERFRVGRGYRVLAAGLPGTDTTTVGGLPATSLNRTLLDVGRDWGVTDAVVALDDALADGRTTPDELAAGVLGQRHWVGIGEAAAAVRLARVGAHSPLETLTRLAFGASGLPEPVLQAAVLRDGRLVAVLDMHWPGTPAFGEVDGRVKWTDPWRGRSPADVGWEEKRRHDVLVDLGLAGTRVAQGDLATGMPAKAARVRSLLAQPLVLPPGVVIVPWRDGLRRVPRATPWTPPVIGGSQDRTA
ncbi:type IV toxin-antitoxin system AbiEi family antitoxin domain-containing protein [Klenkia sp. PcliD-1-E]|uniref:type IV toxin-antitoxin system AbiEi family antitoxin domain-containing protein n=1 Tax=Klenkia sp. PcliD-1-E TaxID=2954492 RepID=UPI002097AEB2|nr:type IV toxin-antitoxin system AbiEi family antitoxin domain-containing protein [Klenkia sp. PcliD-1-E]MCO7220301.1 type IV toxin-antitoxin system AbiEi family antitoxin domain-containing protein [Klenkia sp. PcliD-1-E]